MYAYIYIYTHTRIRVYMCMYGVVQSYFAWGLSNRRPVAIPQIPISNMGHRCISSPGFPPYLETGRKRRSDRLPIARFKKLPLFISFRCNYGGPLCYTILSMCVHVRVCVCVCVLHKLLFDLRQVFGPHHLAFGPIPERPADGRTPSRFH